MFGNAFSGWHLVIILLIVLLLFGAPKLPGLAKSVGQSMRIFKNEVKTLKDDDKSADAASSADNTAASDSAVKPETTASTVEPPLKP
ncbi:Sec-independent protein translocase subunit TatA [Plantibacter sp. Mn2098]|uniref:Sec-independent protein translocase subunit TatA n=1 Tax=Plantibacter sp. Mn2098 TaxID=3395266 RepID=UPI003BDDC2E1